MPPRSPGPARSAIFAQIAGWLAPAGWDAPPELPAEADWPLVIEASSHHLVTPALGWRMRHAAGLPPPAAEYLQAMLFLNAERNGRLLAGLADVGRRLNMVGIVPQLLKGAGLLAGGFFPDRGMRFAGDLDLLLPAAQLEAAREVLAHGGFNPVEDPADGPDRHQLPMMVHRETGLGVELHRHPVTKALAPLANGPALLARGVAIELDGAVMTLPAPSDRAVLAVAHGQIKDRGHARGVPPLRALLDLALHQHRFAEAIDWQEVDRRFDSVGRRALFHDTLALSRTLMQIEPPFALLPRSAEAVSRLGAALDRSRSGKAWTALADMARAFPATLAKHPSQQLAALSPARWRKRLSRFHPRW